MKTEGRPVSFPCPPPLLQREAGQADCYPGRNSPAAQLESTEVIGFNFSSGSSPEDYAALDDLTISCLAAQVSHHLGN